MITVNWVGTYLSAKALALTTHAQNKTLLISVKGHSHYQVIISFVLY